MVRPGYSADGSPVALYVRLAGDREAGWIEAQAAPGSSVLDLGCGAGRLANILVEHGYEVTGVDHSPDMLSHLRGVEGIEAELVGLDLGRTFDVVLVWSNLINTPDVEKRNELVATCRRHVAPTGIVLIVRNPPDWGPESSADAEDGIATTFTVHEATGGRYAATVSWEFDGQMFDQTFEAEVVDDAMVQELAGRHGLTVDAVLPPRDMLVRLRPL